MFSLCPSQTMAVVSLSPPPPPHSGTFKSALQIQALTSRMGGQNNQQDDLGQEGQVSKAVEAQLLPPTSHPSDLHAQGSRSLPVVEGSRPCDSPLSKPMHLHFQSTQLTKDPKNTLIWSRCRDSGPLPFPPSPWNLGGGGGLLTDP